MNGYKPGISVPVDLTADAIHHACEARAAPESEASGGLELQFTGSAETMAMLELAQTCEKRIASAPSRGLNLQVALRLSATTTQGWVDALRAALTLAGSLRAQALAVVARLGTGGPEDPATRLGYFDQSLRAVRFVAEQAGVRVLLDLEADATPPDPLQARELIDRLHGWVFGACLTWPTDPAAESSCLEAIVTLRQRLQAVRCAAAGTATGTGSNPLHAGLAAIDFSGPIFHRAAG